MTVFSGGVGSADLLPAAATIPSSWLHEVFRAADAQERATGHPVTRLHVGEPYFGPPEGVAAALAHAVLHGHAGYGPVEGMVALREALVAKLATANGIDSAVSRVFATPGSCQGLLALLLALAEPGAELLLPEMHWPVHLQQALLAGYRPVFYPLGHGHRPDPAAVLAAGTPRTRVLVLNSPANPTGAVLGVDDLRILVDGARSRGWQVVSDEAYEDYVYTGEHVSPAALERDVPVEERVVHSVFSFSKSLAMTGYRLGYVATATERAARVLGVVQEANIIGPATPVQHAGLAAVALRAEAAAGNRDRVRRNRDTALPALVDAGLLPALPDGGWYAVLDVTRTGLDAEVFADRLLRHRGVAVVPGTGFALRPDLDKVGTMRSIVPAPWSRNLMRIAMCVAPEALAAGVHSLLEFVDECGRTR